MALATITTTVEPTTAFGQGDRTTTQEKVKGWNQSFDVTVYAIRATQASAGNKTVLQLFVDGVQQGGDLTLNNANTRQVNLPQGWFVPANSHAEIRFRENSGIAVTLEIDYETTGRV